MALLVPTQFLRAQIHSSSSSPAAPRRRKPSSSSSFPSVVAAADLPDIDLSSVGFPAPRLSVPWERKNALTAFTSASAAVAAAAGGGFLFHLSSPPPPLPPPSGGGGGGGGWGWGGDGGGFWSNVFSPLPASANEDEQSASGGAAQWDSHGLPANIVVQLNKLSGLKRYKISEILFFDRRRSSTVTGTEDSFFEMVSLRPGGVYTKAQLQKELETLISCGMFERVDLEGKTKPDGTLALTVSFVESTWQAADSFRCINVGLMSQSKQMDMDPDMTDKEKLEYFRNQERDYRRRIERSRPCLLPVPVQREVLQMLREQGKVSARLLQRIRDRVQKWYHDEGYACAQVVNFGNLNTREVVCEVVEGDITQLAIQFHDKLGNVCEGNTQLAVIRRELPKQVSSRD